MEAPMEGSVLSFLKAEWKVSETSAAYWANSNTVWFKFQTYMYRYNYTKSTLFTIKNYSAPARIWKEKGASKGQGLFLMITRA
jgi:hypothetical protein